MAASSKVSELAALEIAVDSDLFLVSDVSASGSRKITLDNLAESLEETTSSQTVGARALEVAINAFGETNLIVDTLIVGG